MGHCLWTLDGPSRRSIERSLVRLQKSEKHVLDRVPRHELCTLVVELRGCGEAWV